MKIGDTVYIRVLPKTNAERDLSDISSKDEHIIESSICKIGRKYIYAKVKYHTYQFDIDTLMDASDVGYKMFLTRSEAMESIEAEEIIALIREWASAHCGRRGEITKEFTIDELRAVKSLLHI